MSINLLSKLKTRVAFLSLLLLSIFSVVAFAQAPPTPTPTPPPTAVVISGLSAQSMLIRIATQIPQLMRLVTALAYVMGMVFIILGVIQLKHFGESRTMMSREHSLMKPLITLFVGVALLYTPTAVQVGMSTFFAEPNPYGMVIPEDPYGDFIRVVYLIVQFVGAVGFIRGLVILSHMGGQGGHQPGTLSRGLLHIIGGIFCINIYQVVQIILYTLGIGIST